MKISNLFIKGLFISVLLFIYFFGRPYLAEKLCPIFGAKDTDAGIKFTVNHCLQLSKVLF